MDFSEEMIDEIFKIFQVESEEIISRLNNNLLDLEKDPSNKESILLLFRDAHTLKGASRMVGFNNVQVLAHKMEDILGLAKENKISLNSRVVNILYKTVDFLSELIQKSIQKGQEIYSEDIPKQIAALEGIENFADEAKPDNGQAEFNAELFIQNIDKINDLIPESLFVLMRIEIEKDGALISSLLSVIRELYSIFENAGPYELKKWAEDIKVKLEFITKASNSLTMEETGDIHLIIDNIINKLTSICELHGIEAIDYYSLAFAKTSGEEARKRDRETETEEIVNSKWEIEADVSLRTLPTQNVLNAHFEERKNIVSDEAIQENPPSNEEELQFIKDPSPQPSPAGGEGANPSTLQSFNLSTTDELSDLVFIQDKIAALLTHGSSISEIKYFLVNYEATCANDDVKNILQKIIEILNFASENEIQFDEETISVLKQSVEYCDNTMKNRSETSDKELILQRLEIIQQILSFNEEKPENAKFVASRGSGIKNKKITDLSDIFNTGELKTLRVDSSKLDTLVNQVNELTITKIKTKKHLHELGIINQELEEWQRNSIKALNYLKYYDKKYFQVSGNDSSISQNSPFSFFIKQLLTLFNDNNKKVQETVSDISNLQRTIQEDDMKIGLAVDNLESMVKNIRVLPLATVFHLFGRMVRDIAQEKNKKIEFEIIGSETSTDKKIIEEIKSPLIHIIRNSIDHGVETPEERIALGKNPIGKIVLSARQVNNKVIIEIKDDGRGINLEKIKDKALQKGFLTQEDLNSMSDEQITNIIFAPGFSTGEQITNISGRGIGLDVVQSKISQLNGKVRVISETNKGCCVQIELPTTMSIIKAFLVQSSGQTFAIPMDTIQTVLRKKKEEIISSNNGKSIIFKDETILLYNLADILNLPKDNSEKNRETILIIENDNKIIALGVDKLIGDQEILHKKLSAPFYKLKNIAGITTLISGEICLILNISDILKVTSNFKTRAIPAKTNQKQQNSSYKILLVDDSITTRTLEKNILSKAGYCIELAENPIEAFQKMKLNRFDLIISDIEMPEMNGFEFLEKLKTDEMFADIPVIMVSSLISDENKKRAAKLGAKKYIVKGEFEQDDFQETISKILRDGCI